MTMDKDLCPMCAGKGEHDLRPPDGEFYVIVSVTSQEVANEPIDDDDYDGDDGGPPTIWSIMQDRINEKVMMSTRSKRARARQRRIPRKNSLSAERS